MAENTSKAWRNQVIYSVYVRNHTAEGTFEAVRRDLARIKALGADIIWFLPVHPIGEKGHKGTLGCPYAIRDYRAVNPEYGTLDDFKRLVDGIHAHGMKCIIDVVYNHTSPDSWLAQHHPEWFYHKPDGSFGNRIGDWSDVIDLDYSQPGLWEYQIETLKYWASIVDGFRCDVAPLVPIAFWRRARGEVEAVRPGCFWLAESVEPAFLVENRARGMVGHSDSELYQAFDACYDYDIFPQYQMYLKGEIPLCTYTESINRQEYTYPDNYVKLRFLENHDQSRAAFVIPDEKSLANWTAFLFFQKGITLVYGGQEASCTHLPSLFDRDPVDWKSGRDLSPLIQRLTAMKRDALFADSRYFVQALPRGIARAEHTADGARMVGVFSLRGEASLVAVNVPDGVYENLAGGGTVEVHGGKIACSGEPVIIRVCEP